MFIHASLITALKRLVEIKVVAAAAGVLSSK